jgi:PKD repeat protein
VILRTSATSIRALLVLALLPAGACDIPVTGGEDCGCPVNETPVATASATPDTGAAPLEVSFSSAGSSDPDGALVAYAWDFGDGGSSIEEDPTHVFTDPGTYTVTLTVIDDRGGADTTTLTVTVTTVDGNVPPVAMASATPESGEAPVDVAFSSAGSSDADGAIVAYAWDFGDGGASTEADPLHTFAAAGAYTVTLTVTDDDGATGAATVTVTVTSPIPNAPPTAVIAITPTGVTGEEVFYDSTGSSDSDGTIVAYAWDLGDGRTSTDPNPDWVYDVQDTYTVTLTVTDDDGATDTATMSYVVTDNPRGRYVGVDGSDLGNNDCTSSLAKCLTINYAISQAVDGDTVYVSPGAYDEVVDPNKALTFKGKNVGVNSGPTDTEERRPETIVKAFRNAADTSVWLDFELNGFLIDPQGDTALFPGEIGLVNIFGGSTVTVVNNLFRGADALVPDCSFTCATMGDYALRAHSGGVDVHDNRFENWRRPLDIAHTDDMFPILPDSSIRNNDFVGVTSRAMSIGQITGRTGMPGMIVDGNRVDATGRTGASTPAGITITNHSNQITNNTFIGLSSGVYLQICKKFNTDDNVITGNSFIDNGAGVNVTTYNDGTACVNGATEGVGNWITGGGRVYGLEVTGNSFTGSTSYAVRFNPDFTGYTDVVTQGTLDVTCNWYGDAAGPSDPASPGDRVLQGPPGNAQMVYTPWLTSEGGACDGGP